MSILVTGGAGFIGRAIIASLPESVPVTCIDVLEAQAHAGRTTFPAWLSDRARCIRADIRDTAAYADTLHDVDVVIHLAAQTGTGQSMYERSRYVGHNVDGTACLLDALALHAPHLSRIVLASSRAVYGEGMLRVHDGRLLPAQRTLERLSSGQWNAIAADGSPGDPVAMQEDFPCNPTSVYGLTKWWQEQLIVDSAARSGVHHTILRIQNAYGPGQELRNPYTGIIGIFCSLLFRDLEIELFEDGEVMRDFVYVDDVADAFVRAAVGDRPPYSIMNIGSRDAVSLRTLVERLGGAAGRTPRVRVSGRYRVGDIRHAIADTTRCDAWLQGGPRTSLEEGLRRYWAWFSEQEALATETLRESFEEMERSGVLRASEDQ